MTLTSSHIFETFVHFVCARREYIKWNIPICQCPDRAGLLKWFCGKCYFGGKRSHISKHTNILWLIYFNWCAILDYSERERPFVVGDNDITQYTHFNHQIIWFSVRWLYSWTDFHFGPGTAYIFQCEIQPKIFNQKYVNALRLWFEAN